MTLPVLEQPLFVIFTWSITLLAGFVLSYACYNMFLHNLSFLPVHSREKENKLPRGGDRRCFGFSLIVPIKDEEKVVGRLLDSIVRISYPYSKFELILVLDGSTDGSLKICQNYASRLPIVVKVLQRNVSNGKPGALNFALKHARGDIICVLDADSVVPQDLLTRVSTYFQRPKIAAVQGQTISINPLTNALTRLLWYEEGWIWNLVRGRKILNLFIPLNGNCQFIRGNILKALGGWKEESLTEDVELSARLKMNGHRVEYAPDVVCYQETPSKLSTLFHQRRRWFRGYMETAVAYGRLLWALSPASLDAESVLFAPYFILIGLTLFLLSLSLSILNIEFFVRPLGTIFMFLTIATIISLSLDVLYSKRPRKMLNLLWIPIIYAYWLFLGAVTCVAVSDIFLRRPRLWVKTPKQGLCDPIANHENTSGEDATENLLAL